MRSINLLAVVAAAVVAFIASAVYYTLLGSIYAELRGITPTDATPPVWEVLGQFARNIVVASVFAYFISRFRVTGVKESLVVGLWVWVGFQAMQILGAVLHENYPIGLYAIHVGDALMTTLIMTAIVGAWPRKEDTQKMG